VFNTKPKTKKRRMKRKYIQHFLEVHTSNDGQRWHKGESYLVSDTREPDKKSNPLEPTPEAKAKAAVHKLGRTVRYVRTCKVERKVEVLSQSENKGILSTQEITALLSAGRVAVAGIPGLTVSEGFDIAFGSDEIVHGPTRVSVTFHAEQVLGKPPRAASTSLADREAARAAKREWDVRAVEACKKALGEAQVKLREAKIGFRITSSALYLVP
jgi:hypothetical protein